ncbi:MAG TPA: glycosyltransferase family 9 protein [Candidatus Paceibacterota bacterium]|nr:glycosyltransferase family 9 protein [Candidatus Paceibacterota bacterium]
MKFFIKWTLAGWAARVLLALFGSKVNKEGWEDRVLIVDFHGIGDVIIATSVLAQYRRHFGGKKIHLAIARQSGLSPAAFGDTVDEVIKIDSSKFGTNPLYALRSINMLREIGFSEVVNQCLGIKEKTSRVVAASLGAQRVVGYEGPWVELRNPESARFDRYARRHVFPRYAVTVPSIDRDFDRHGGHPANALLHHDAIRMAVTGGAPAREFSLNFHIDPAAVDGASRKMREMGLAKGRYVVLVPGASDPMKRWQVEKFAAVAAAVHARGFGLATIGSPDEAVLGRRIAELASVPLVNGCGAFSLAESSVVVANAHSVITNDTGPVHVAVALGVPSVCIPAGAHLGMNSLYGRRGVNRWVYKDVGCLYDDWRCAATVPVGEPAPCIAAVEADDVIREFDGLLDYLKRHPVRNEPFEPTFL